MRGIRRALAVLALLASTTPARTALADELTLLSGSKVAGITISGNHAFSEGKLKGLMNLRTPSLFHPFRRSVYRRSVLKGDVGLIRNFYQDAGYFLVTVRDSISVEKKGVRVFIRVDEGRKHSVRGVAFRGIEKVPVRDLTRGFKTVAGATFSPFRLEGDRTLLADRYANRGYIYAQVGDSIGFAGTQVDVLFHVVEDGTATIDTVTIEGRVETRNVPIERELTFGAGETFRRNRVLESQRRIYDLGFYNDVQFEADSLDASGLSLALRIKVRERRLAWADGGVGYSSNDRLRLSGEWGTRNFLRMGRRLLLRASSAFEIRDLFRDNHVRVDEGRVELGYFAWWLAGTRIRSELTPYFRYDREPGFRQRAAGVTYTARREISRTVNLQGALEQRWVWNKVDTSEVSVRLDPTKSREHYVTRLFDVSLTRDKRDDFFDPGRGSYQQAFTQFAGGVFGGENDFQKVTLTSSWYNRIFGSTVLATRLRVGTIFPRAGADSIPGVQKVPFEDRFLLGGATTVRGYAEETLGPTLETAPSGGLAVYLANAELRFPLFWKLSGAVFLDSGGLWDDREQFRLDRFVPSFSRKDTTLRDVRYSTGGGIRLATPVGPIRLDYGWKVNRNEDEQPDAFHFSLGQAF